MLLWIIAYLVIGFLIVTLITNGKVWNIKELAKSASAQADITWYIGAIIGILVQSLIWPYRILFMIKCAYQINHRVESYQGLFSFIF